MIYKFIDPNKFRKSLTSFGGMKSARLHSGRPKTPQQFVMVNRHRLYIPLKPPAQPPHLKLSERMPAIHVYPSSLITPSNPRKSFDSESIPNCISFSTNHEIHSSHKIYEEAPPLPLVTDKEFENVLSKKLVLCSEVFDFTDPDSEIQAKELKEKYLFELIDLFNNEQEAQLLNPKFQRGIFYMIESNIFRKDPIFPTKQQTLDFVMTVTEPSWPHLFYCYQILNRFVTLFPDAEFVNLSVVHKAITLTQLPDANERNQLVSFLRIFYDNRPNDRLQLINFVNNQLQSLIEGYSIPYCGMPMIVLLTHIISHTPPPLPDYLMKVIKESLIPAISLPYLSLYLINVKQFFSAILTVHPDNIVEILRHMQRVWPLTNASKQQQCLDILLFVFAKMTRPIFKPISHSSFAFLAQFVNSEHTKLSETVMEIWLKQPPDEWIVENSRVGIVEMFDAISIAATSHWCRINMEKANLVLNEMAKINKTQFHKMKIAQKQAQAQKPPPKKSNTFIRKWTYITKKASRRGYDVNIDEEVEIISEYFSNDKESASSKVLTHYAPAVFEKMPSKNDHSLLY
ncbi:hypothetical protein TRFO_03292 [Tritrichomonas foetus]|uniref:Phosphoprotein phosphatase n=1 Tax=Tritrichomonas foetus TaxID=1144522 RepID=A0A1J4KV22_9EUKA|nr:hypothetical protein TRFO_03292 [Tritrichomonas foetus]|eukprot:OHT13550.1 hypothetical protein TRFO_03292 [Tritrichomonas foetus]